MAVGLYPRLSATHRTSGFFLLAIHTVDLVKELKASTAVPLSQLEATVPVYVQFRPKKAKNVFK